jgi:prolyl oligopeptidase
MLAMPLLLAVPAGADVLGFAATAESDPYLWLEEIEGERALDWVRDHNEVTLGKLESDHRFGTFQSDMEASFNATDRIPSGHERGGYVYNFWQDRTHVRGLWRRTTLQSYRKDEQPDREPLLDFDVLAEAENENWIYKGVTALEPDGDRALVKLSRGGKDAVVIREFDVEAREFVDDGFHLPEAKSDVAWLDRNTVLVETDFGEGSLTVSGYSRLVKKWRRGTPLEAAQTVFEGELEDVGVGIWVNPREDGPLAMILRVISTFDYELFLYDVGELRKLPLPSTVRPEGVIAGQLLLRTSEEWKRPGSETIPAGTLFSFSVPSFLEKGELPPLDVVLRPDDRTTISGVSTSRSAVWINTLHNVRGELHRYSYDSLSGWSSAPVDLPSNGSVGIVSSSVFSDVLFARYTSYLVPTRLVELDPESLTADVLRSLPERFDASGCVVEQHQAISTDGERIPYFLVRPREVPLDGTIPTVLYGYGGFEISQKPYYSQTFGKLWMERWGALAVANIRGGGEFGPRWHRAALKEKRQISFDDFHAVAEDLVDRGVTSPDKLGIMGGSQGGLLVGVAFTQRPDLYGATVCSAPLLDMLRYAELPPGASWKGEYGDPADPEMRSAIAAYSPYHNIRPDRDYRNGVLRHVDEG